MLLDFKTWGGRRPGAGRKPKGQRAGVSHRPRRFFPQRHPLHVTARMLQIRSLRRPRCYRVVRRALGNGSLREGFRVAHFSVQSNHIHLICEADDRLCLSRGLQGLFIRIARALNKELGRKGTVFADRYHDRALTTAAEVRNALAYVLSNARRHAAQRGRSYGRGWIDPCSSGCDFDGWSGSYWVSRRLTDDPPLPRARTHLLSRGWQEAGPIRVDEVPGGRRTRRRRPAVTR